MGDLQQATNQRTRQIFLFSFFLIGAASMLVIYWLKPYFPPIRSDGVGYYLYLPAAFIYHDLGLLEIARHVFYGRMPTWTGALWWPSTQQYLIRYPVGEAVMMTPFFFVGWLIAKMAGVASDVFSWPFHFAAALSGLFYATAGLNLLWRCLQRWFDTRTIVVVLIAIIGGTNFFHYATFDNGFSHIYSFFLFTALLYTTQQCYEQNKPSRLLLMGFLGGLIVVTRPTNGLWLIFALLYGITTRAEIKTRISFWLKNKEWVTLGIVSFWAMLCIQLFYWHHVTGQWVVYSYQDVGFHFANPQISQVLFSVRKGLFFWSPLLLTVLPGLWCVYRKTPSIFWGAILFLPVNIYVISSWQYWWYGGSFGQRVFVESLPLFAICLGALLKSLSSRKTRAALEIYIGLCVILSMWLMVKYWNGVIPFDKTTWHYFINTFFQLSVR